MAVLGPLLLHGHVRGCLKDECALLWGGSSGGTAWLSVGQEVVVARVSPASEYAGAVDTGGVSVDGEEVWGRLQAGMDGNSPLGWKGWQF